ncbi:MAG: DUF1553 domain-containing protein [Bryobacterales bacterium]|nr:DUF1553 domain-containing protein [Bryobacterales bacterium]
MMHRLRSPLFGTVLLCAGIAAVWAAPPPAATEKPKEFTAQQKRWWAIQPLAKPAVPAVKQSDWARNEIDAFILAKLEEKNLAPNPPADKLTLLRRASLVLTGLPPTPEKVQAFLADNSPKAFEKVVDELLASPQYGERWARHWLDLARYADSEGFKADETRPHVWRYRDYVIRSFNDDKPYSRFVQEQIAGDEMFPGNTDALVATGFNRHFPDESNAANIHLRRQELLNDITDVVGSTMMGVTVGCARCHDHKFDPILQKDYYRLQAFFANTRIDDELHLDSAERRARHDARQKVWEEKTAPLRAQIDLVLKPAHAKFYADRLSRFPEEIQEVITMEPARRNAFQWQMYHKAKTQVTFTEAEVAGQLRGEGKTAYANLKKQLAAFDHLKPAPLAIAQGMVDASAAAPSTHTLQAGAYNSPIAEVQPGFLTILDPSDAQVAPALNGESTGRRTALAQWLTRADNPLTARVMVNRVWHYHFGRGISASPSDFGNMGERPTHRELLDALALKFIEDGWSLKKLHKQIMLSAVWQQSSQHRADAAEVDPSNKLLWRYNRRRLEGEAIRDSMLQTAGLLNAKMYGPGVFPPLPPGMTTRGGWKHNEAAPETVRRSIYTFVRRNTRYPMFETFDMPDTHESCSRRNVTVSSMQALELLNNELVVDWSQHLAKRVLNDSGMSAQAQVERAWRMVHARTPSAAEAAKASAFLDKQTQLAGSREAALTDLCHMLLNSNEFVYLN